MTDNSIQMKSANKSLDFSQEYLDNLLKLNKNLRDQTEILHKMLRKNLFIHLEEDENEYNKVMSVLNNFEIIQSNYSVLVQEHSTITNKINLIYQTLPAKEQYDNLVNNYKILLKENSNLKLKNKILFDENKKYEKELNNLSLENSKIIKENAQLKISKNQLSSNKSECEKMLERINVLSQSLIDVERKCKKEITEKDLIISKLDEQLQHYELIISCKEEELYQLRSQVASDIPANNNDNQNVISDGQNTIDQYGISMNIIEQQHGSIITSRVNSANNNTNTNNNIANIDNMKTQELMENRCEGDECEVEGGEGNNEGGNEVEG